MRVHICGGAGSGKSTLARVLASQLKLPLLHLDEGGYDRAIGRVLSEQRAKLLRDATELPGWVSEGTFVGWARPFFELADFIVFLDVRPSVAYKRIVLRHVLASARGKNPYKGMRRLARFLQATHAWYASERTRDQVYGVPDGTTGITHLAHARLTLRDFDGKVLTCCTDRDIEGARELLAKQRAG